VPRSTATGKHQVHLDQPTPSGSLPAPARATELELGLLIEDRAALHAAGRHVFGVVGRQEKVPLVPAMRLVGGWKNAIVLWNLAFLDSLVGGSALAVQPDVHATVAGGALGAVVSLRFLLFGLGGVLALTLEVGHVTRVSVARAWALAGGVGIAGEALSTSTLGVFVGASLSVMASGALATSVLPLLFDYYRPELRVSLTAGYVATVVAGLGLAVGALAVVEGVGLTWRTDLLLVAGLAIVGALLALIIEEPPSGGDDHRRIAKLVEDTLGCHGPRDLRSGGDGPALTVGQRFRRTVAPVTAPPMLVAAGIFGLFAWSLSSPISVLFRDRYGLVGTQRSVLLALLWLTSIPIVIWYASRSSAAYRKSPRDLVWRMQGSAITAGVALALATVSPNSLLSFGLLAIAYAFAAALLSSAAFLLLTMSDPANRTYAAVLLGVAPLAGGVIGTQVIATIGNRFGVEWALVVAALLPIGAAGQLGRSATAVDRDLDSVVGRTVESAELSTRKALGHCLPLLSCRNINFSYGQVQVLFDVSLTVDEGEMIALLGTNGAGKSTLLRLVSGLGFPTSGSIHYLGADITFLGSDRRVALGISQIPGGRAVFGPLSVLDNLRGYGYSLGRDRARLERGIEEVFDVLPRLAERRHQLASTLSGGERQMLALAKSYLTGPRLLVIDELSLGLAPIVVSQLLAMVREVNSRGTAVILVEQSVNVALSVVDHAYFMEKGEMRFDGAAKDLLDRPDLLRSVFLKGATAGLKVAPR
jgi:ABC-type branched-subunit amino acid transport system ATPase component